MFLYVTYLLFVRPILKVDVELLKNKFIYGYREDDRVLYISIMNDTERKKEVSQRSSICWFIQVMLKI